MSVPKANKYHLGLGLDDIKPITNSSCNDLVDIITRDLLCSFGHNIHTYLHIGALLGSLNPFP